MYRARVQAVSGSKIYADGKWITCIGNKNFRAGEMVWTDGRCAYGHFQESQQPPIITAPQDDEGIPIISFDFANYDFDTMYTLKKYKFKQVGTLQVKHISSSVIQPVNTMINDKKGNVFISYDNNILAANIDNLGNKFFIISEEQPDSEEPIDDTVIKILKDDGKAIAILQKIPLNRLKEKLQSYIPTDSYFPNDGDKIIGYDPYITFDWAGAFIESENSWWILVGFRSQKILDHYNYASGQQFYSFTPTDSNRLIFRYQTYTPMFFGSEALLNSILDSRPVKLKINADESPGNIDVTIEFDGTTCTMTGRENYCYMAASCLMLDYDPENPPLAGEPKSERFDQYFRCCIKSDGDFILNLNTDGRYAGYDTIIGDDDIWAFNRFLYTHDYIDADKIKLPLDYGCYYTITQCPDTYNPYYTETLTIFSSNGEKITAIIAGWDTRVLIANIKGNYIFNIDAPFHTDEHLPRFLDTGTYIYKNGKLEQFDTFIITNQRLRPMKKIRGWQNRIKEISLDLEKDEN